MTLLLRASPRTGRAFAGYVLLSDAGFDAGALNYLHIGLKSTAGAPTSAADFDADTDVSRNVPSAVHRVALTRLAGGNYSGQLTIRDVTFTHAPGANVKIYAALSSGVAPATDPFAEVSPGVLLQA